MIFPKGIILFIHKMKATQEEPQKPKNSSNNNVIFFRVIRRQLEMKIDL